MSDNAKLITDALRCADDSSGSMKAQYIKRLADALEAAERREVSTRGALVTAATAAAKFAAAIDEAIPYFERDMVNGGSRRGLFILNNADTDSLLREHDREVAEAAWDEGAKRRNGDSFMRENYSQTLAKNPYRDTNA